MRLPTPPDSYSAEWARRVVSDIERAEAASLKRNSNIEIGSASIVLTAANGNRYKLGVDNTGTLTTTLI